MEARPVDAADLCVQALDQTKKPLQAFIREHVVDPERLELASNAIDPAGPLNHSCRIPVEIVVHQVTAIL